MVNRCTRVVHSRRLSKNSRFVYVLLVVLLSLVMLQFFHEGHCAVDNRWGMNFGVQGPDSGASSDNGANVFAPFDLINLYADVTESNVLSPNMQVTFDVQGPIGMFNLTNITRIITTDASGRAEFSFRIPMYADSADSVVGRWEARAVVQTIGGTIQRNLSFDVSWPLEVSSIELLNSETEPQSNYPVGSTVTVLLTLSNNFALQKAANITLNVLDSSQKEIYQIEILNVMVNASSSNRVQSSFEIPKAAASGSATIEAAVFSGSFEGSAIRVSASKTAYFSIVASKSNIIGIISTVFLVFLLLIALGFLAYASFLLVRRREGRFAGQEPRLPPAVPKPVVPDFSVPKEVEKALAPEGMPEPPADTTVIQNGNFPSLLMTAKSVESAARKVYVLKKNRNELVLELGELGKVADAKAESLEIEVSKTIDEIRRVKAFIKP